MTPLTLTAERALHALAATQSATLSEPEFTTDEREDAYRELVQAGLIGDDAVKTLAGTHLAFNLTSSGRRTAQQLQRGFAHRLLQRRMLTCVGAGITSTDDADISGIEPARSPDDVAEAIRELRELGYLEGTPTWGGPMLRPRLTSAGRRCLETDYAPEVFATISSRAGIQDNRSFRVQAAHIGSIQQGDYSQVGLVSQGVGDHLNGLSELIDRIRSLANDITDPDLAELAQEQANDIERASNEGKPQKVRALLMALLASAATTFGEEAGRQVADAAGEVLRHITG